MLIGPVQFYIGYLFDSLVGATLVVALGRHPPEADPYNCITRPNEKFGLNEKPWEDGPRT